MFVTGHVHRQDCLEQWDWRNQFKPTVSWPNKGKSWWIALLHIKTLTLGCTSDASYSTHAWKALRSTVQSQFCPLIPCTSQLNWLSIWVATSTNRHQLAKTAFRCRAEGNNHYWRRWRHHIRVLARQQRERWPIWLLVIPFPCCSGLKSNKSYFLDMPWNIIWQCSSGPWHRLERKHICCDVIR